MLLTRSQAREYIYTHPELILQPDKSGGFICPLCGGGTGKNGTGLVVQKDKRHFSCFSNGQCFKNKDIFDIVGYMYGLTAFTDKINKAAELVGVELVNDGSPAAFSCVSSPSQAAALRAPAYKDEEQQLPQDKKEQKDYTTAFHLWHSYIDQTDYWKRRGLTRETVSRFKIGYHPNFKVKEGGTASEWQALIIPITAHAFAVRNTDENAAHGSRHRKVGKAALFNPLRVDFDNLDKAVFIVEGELDALSVIQSGGFAVALRSTDNVPAFIERLRASQAPLKRYIFGLLDSDEAGQRATEQLQEGLKDSNFLFKGFNLKEFKDPNDFLIKAPEEMKKFIENINGLFERSINHE